ncbi:MAG TPA: ABC transporter permease subunit [Solirubrobacteraceae bacterium]|nr:ABC transporter permease subunit [Solirubrobacteraceae bacterium]
MLGAFSSEWRKLRRRSMLVWGVGGGLLCSVFATALTIERTRRTFPPGAGARFHVTIAQLSRPDGFVHGVLTASNLIGIVSLCLFAGAVAIEYSQGTLRILLVCQPRRGQLLTGKFLALAAFVGIAIALAVSVAAGVAFALGPSKGINTSPWTTGAGLDDLGQTILHVYLASVGYGILGTALAILLRSSALAITIGVAYALPGEAIISRFWSSGDRWLPGQLLSALAHGGTTTASYTRALVILSIYATVVAAGTLVIFGRRDV